MGVHDDVLYDLDIFFFTLKFNNHALINTIPSLLFKKLFYLLLSFPNTTFWSDTTYRVTQEGFSALQNLKNRL